MVSVLLRMLEYYSGILFLTTNRVGTIDEAFKSRIHIKIWRVNFRRSQDQVDADEEALLKFAKKHFKSNDEGSRWYGRQIYNASKTAIALAQFETLDIYPSQKPQLLPDYFKQVAHPSRKFDEYLFRTQGGETYSVINRQQKVRADRFGMEEPRETIQCRSTRTRKLDMDELPSWSEEDSDDSEEKRKAAKKKKEKSSSSKRSDDKKSKKSKKTKKHDSDDSDAVSPFH
ncbi:hypothetical protein NA57DRAFT_51566 [Rhizodiscina lignyota]|uniref:AAA+ ATPase lid domain-containing protein n=1 Tax=Rhizodiscina lignyota TaxID=1504668 RepID=A0A9P4IUN5_9PEZI|nr:hypothetical protein NA57DRAFT_51566 [Rhizodiscina lignyota]